VLWLKGGGLVGTDERKHALGELGQDNALLIHYGQKQLSIYEN